MSKENHPGSDTRSYVVMEVDTPAVIQVKTEDIFYAKQCKMTESFVTAVGNWSGNNGSTRTVVIPVTSVVYIEFTAREVSEDQVPKEHRNAVATQIENL